MNNRKILVVEDEALSAMFLQMVLKKAGYLIHKIVASGEEAIQNVSLEKPDVILMDINLAGAIDGIEAAKEINEKNNIPIIFMTGYPDHNHMKRAEELNPVKYFVKPFETEDLLQAIASIP